MTSRAFIMVVIALSASGLNAAPSSTESAAGQNASAVYCMEIHRLSLIQLERVYANIPGSAESPNGRAQLAQHRARLANAENFVKPRLGQMDPGYVTKVMAAAAEDFQHAGQATNACVQSCADDSCRALCITKPDTATRRVDSCLHRSW